MTTGAQIKKAILIGLLTCVVMALSAYALHWGAKYIASAWGVEIGLLSFNILFSLVAGLVIWACAGKFLKELKREADKKGNQA